MGTVDSQILDGGPREKLLTAYICEKSGVCFFGVSICRKRRCEIAKSPNIVGIR
jgi:hypothetical protein